MTTGLATCPECQHSFELEIVGTNVIHIMVWCPKCEAEMTFNVFTGKVETQND